MTKPSRWWVVAVLIFGLLGFMVLACWQYQMVVLFFSMGRP